LETTSKNDPDKVKEFTRYVKTIPAVCAKDSNGMRCGLLADKMDGSSRPLDSVGKSNLDRTPAKRTLLYRCDVTQARLASNPSRTTPSAQELARLR